MFRSKRWSSFCGVDKDVFEKHLESTLKELSYEYEVVEGPSVFMLGPGSSSIYNIRSPVKIGVRVITATGDPVLRLVSSFMGTSSRLRGICVIEIAPVTEEAEPHIKKLVQTVVGKFGKMPWDLKHHPRFRSSPLLVLRVKRQWKRWLE